MSLNFPRTDIFDDLCLRDGFLTPRFRQEISRTAGGRTRVKDIGPMLWEASYQTVPLSYHRSLEVQTDLLSLQGGIELFEGYDPRRPNPKFAIDADDLSAVFVNSISADRTRISLRGLPVDFTLSKADYLSIDDGVSLHLLDRKSVV